MNTTMIFLTIDELKAQLGVKTLDVVKNPNTGKLFASGDGRVNIKIEQAIDKTLPIRFMHEPDKFNEGCIVNVTPSSAPLFSL